MIIVYTIDDLRRDAEDKSFLEITTTDFRSTHEPVNVADMVVYMDDNKVRILKHRHVGKKMKDELRLIGIRPFDIKIDG